MKLCKWVGILFLLVSSIVLADSSRSSAIQDIIASGASKPTGPYSEGTLVDLRKGRLLFISGQTEDDPQTGKLMDENIGVATNRAMDNIEAVLKAAGSSWENVVRMDIYLADMKDWPGMNKEYMKRFPNGVYPARTAVQVKSEYRIEMTCIAFVPDKE